MKIKPAKNQDIIDVCLQHFGTYKPCVDVAEANGLAVDHRFDGVEEIEIDEPVAGEVKRRLRGQAINPISGSQNETDTPGNALKINEGYLMLNGNYAIYE